MSTENENRQAAAAVEDEETKNALKKLLEHLRHFFEWASNLRNNNSIIQQMQQLQDDIELAVANGEMTKDSLDSLCELVTDMEGRLDTISPETVEEEIAVFEEKCNRIIQTELSEEEKQQLDYGEESLLEEMDKEARYDEILLNMRNSGVEFPSFSERNNQIIESSMPEAKQMANKAFWKKCGFTLNENAKGVEIIAPKLDDDNKAVLDENGKQLFTTTTVYDISETDAYEKTLPLRERQSRFVKEHLGNAKLTENGRIQSEYFDDKTFRVRDAETGDMLRVELGKGKIDIYAYRDTKDFDASGKEVRLARFEQVGEKVRIISCIQAGNADISALLQCDEMEKFLDVNGVTADMRQTAFSHETDQDKYCAKVDKNSLGKVEKLKEACERALKKQTDGMYTISPYNGKNATFLNAAWGESRISFSFDKEGNPLTIRYRNNPADKSKFVYNIKARTVSKEYISFRDTDPTFNKMFTAACSALKEIGIDVNKSTRASEMQTTEKIIDTRKDSERFNIPLSDRNLDDGGMYSEMVKMTDENIAKTINKIALHAIENEERNISLWDIENLTGNKNVTDARMYMDSLASLGIVQGWNDSKPNADVKMTLSKYSDLVVKLATDRSERERLCGTGEDVRWAAYLVDAYAEYSKQQEAQTGKPDANKPRKAQERDA